MAAPRIDALLVLFLLILQPCFAAQAPLERFMNQSFEPGQAVSSFQLNGSGGDLAIITADGRETYLYNSSSGKAVFEKGAIESALLSDLYARERFEQRTLALMNLSWDISSIKSANEKKCMQYLGVDMHPCNGTEACKVSCFAVPQCEVMIHSDGFLEAMMQWNEGRKKFDALLAAYSGGVESIRNDTGAIEAKRATLSELAALSRNLSQSTLFLGRGDAACSGKNALRCYEYCPIPDYSPGRIDLAMGELSSVKLVLLSAGGQPARAGALLNSSLQNEAYLASRGRDYEQFRIQMKLGISNLASRVAELEKTVNDTRVKLAFFSLTNISSQANSEADLRMYKKALSRKIAYERAESDLEDLISHDSAIYSSLVNRMAAVGQKINKSEGVIGAESALKYSLRLANLKKGFAPPVPVMNISAGQSDLDSLEQNLSSEISEKSASGQSVSAGNISVGLTTSPSGEKHISVKLPSAIPCLPALALLVSLGFVFFGRR